MEWRVQAIRGATTASENTIEAMRESVLELLDVLETQNQLDPTHIISATFSVTRDLDAIFPASIARERTRWQDVPLLDVQHMHVDGSLERCIRLLIHVHRPVPLPPVHHTYLRQARNLRPEWAIAPLGLG